MNFYIRHATVEDIDRLLPIYDNARAYMRANGNMHQWTDGYPGPAQLLADVAANQLYVCMDGGQGDDRIVGVFVYFEGIDPTYLRIYDGAWLNDAPYGVLHRIAVAVHGRGVASFCFDWCFSRCKNLKIDTHRDNIPMQRSLARNGFTRCGIIYLESGDERIAFQKSAL